MDGPILTTRGKTNAEAVAENLEQCGPWRHSGALDPDDPRAQLDAIPNLDHDEDPALHAQRAQRARRLGL